MFFHKVTAIHFPNVNKAQWQLFTTNKSNVFVSLSEGMLDSISFKIIAQTIQLMPVFASWFTTQL